MLIIALHKSDQYRLIIGIKILHFIVKKPWQNKPLVLLEEGTLWQERYWFDYYSKILKLKHG